MGTNHQEIILKHLVQWRTLTLLQGKALSEGDLDRLEKLTIASSSIQSRLVEIFAELEPAPRDRQSVALLQEIQSLQAGLIIELEKGSRELSDTLDGLRKSRTSLLGYRQSGSPGPRFMNERT